MNYREILEDFVNNENTEYCYDWQGFDYKTILPCIEQLLKNENNLQSKIDKVNELLEERKESVEDISWVEMKVEDYIEEINEIEFILKEEK